MCGIIGINATNENVIPSIIIGLKNLEYRGYDSAGIAGLVEGKLKTVKVQGKIAILEQAVINSPLKESNIAIGHTRWATHGAANNINAHPHQTEQVSVVHNGIIENFLIIKQELLEAGHKFTSETDSEVIPHLITYYLNQGNPPLNAVNKALKKLDGAFAIAVIFHNFKNIIIAARKGSPLVIGYGKEQNIIASDTQAIAFLTNKISYLEEGDIAVLTDSHVEIYNQEQPVVREVITIDNNAINLGKGNFRHYMLKEIFEQPTVLANVINAYYDFETQEFNWANLTLDFNKVSKITIIACGTSYYAAMVAKYWLEEFTNIPVEVDISSEFRYRKSYLPENGLCIFISQSGETADTLAAMRHAKQKGQTCLSIVNVKQSSIDREADISLQCFAGPEIGVASTKAFTTQLIVLLLLTLHISRQTNKISQDTLLDKLRFITEIPGRIAEFLTHEDEIKAIAKDIALAKDIIYIGRNYIYPIALEGALKLKELSYIHAEAIAAGELKHGPIALVDDNMPVIVLAPQNHLFEKTASNAQEVAARGGKLITLSSAEGNKILQNLAKHQLNVSPCDPLIDPIIYTLPMQLLAYHVAVMKGTDVDQPRNLAKSVTVE